MLMLDESPAIPRLGIKKFFWWSEALHGAANMGNVTNFPEPVGMAASFNPELLYKVFDVASTEFRAQYNHRIYDLGGEDMKMRSLSVWTPNVNIFRDPRWGRGQETYGEDPYLTSVMGVQVVKGLQARGAFTVDMSWSNGQLQKATITSKIGGTLRLRSYVPLKGNGLRPASGACPNPLFASPEIPSPLHSAELKEFPLIPLKDVFEYDIDTVPGQTITIKRQ